MKRCTTKEVKKLEGGGKIVKSWCGREILSSEWAFLDATHLIQSVGGSIQPCKKCVKSVVSELGKEL